MFTALIFSLALAEAFATDVTQTSSEPAMESTATLASKDCLYVSRIKRTKVLNDEVIMFETRDRKVWRNTLDNRCPQLGFYEAFSYEVRGGQLCHQDWIYVLQTGAGNLERGHSCGLGSFEQLEGKFSEVVAGERKRLKIAK